MIDTILMDLDNTILDFNKAEAYALAKTLEAAGIDPSPRLLARFSAVNLSLWKRLELGELTVEQVKRKRFEQFFQEFHISFSPADAAHTYENLLREGDFLMEGAKETLTALSGSYRLYLATNGTARVQRSRIKKAGVARFFEKIFISGEIGYNKPDIRFFDACFSQIPDFARERTVMIGDSLTSDIKGGKNAGIRTLWFHPDRRQPDQDILPDCECHSLRDIPRLL